MQILSKKYGIGGPRVAEEINIKPLHSFWEMCQTEEFWLISKFRSS